MDIWNYIFHENIEIVDLYFAKKRPTVIRQGSIFMVDDNRFPLEKNEKIVLRKVRFRTLGCYPLTAATLSNAITLQSIIKENMNQNFLRERGD